MGRVLLLLAARTLAAAFTSFHTTALVAAPEWHGVGLHGLLSAQEAAPDAPLMLFDRHLEKNGGFSMHTAMQNSVTAAGSKLNCTRLFGYQINNKDWVEMASLLTQKQSICVDGHSPVPSDWLQRARCRVRGGGNGHDTARADDAAYPQTDRSLPLLL